MTINYKEINKIAANILDKKSSKKISWNRYLSFYQRLCSPDISFPMLCQIIPFYYAYDKNVPHRALMDQIEHQFRLENYTPLERIQNIRDFIETWNTELCSRDTEIQDFTKRP